MPGPERAHQQGGGEHGGGDPGHLQQVQYRHQSSELVLKMLAGKIIKSNNGNQIKLLETQSWVK